MRWALVLGIALALGGPAAANEATAWKVERSRDKQRGTPIIVVSRQSDDTWEMADGSQVRGEIVLRCSENTTAAVFFFRAAVDPFFTPIFYRIDDKPVAASTWLSGDDEGAVGLFSGASAIPFIKGLFGAKTLAIQAAPPDAPHTTFTFPLQGLDEAITPLRETCEWGAPGVAGVAGGPRKSDPPELPDTTTEAYLIKPIQVPAAYRPRNYVSSSTYIPTYTYIPYVGRGLPPPRFVPSYRPSAMPMSRPNVTPSVTPAAMPISRASVTPSATPTARASVTPSVTPPSRPPATPSATPTARPTATSSATPPPRPTATPSTTPTSRPSATPTPTPTTTSTYRPSDTSSTTPTYRSSATPSYTPTYRPSSTPSYTPTYRSSSTPSYRRSR